MATDKAYDIKQIIIEEIRVDEDKIHACVLPDSKYPLVKFTSKNNKLWKVGYIFELNLFTVRVFCTAGSVDADRPEVHEMGANLSDVLIKALALSKK